MRKFKKEQWWALLAIITLALLAVATEFIFRQLKDIHIILGICFSSAIVLIIFLAILSYKIGKIVSDISKLMVQQPKKGNIVTLKDIEEIECNLKNSEIWELTSDLSWDLEGQFWKIVKENIHKRNNKYIFFLPKKQEERYEDLVKRLEIDKLKDKNLIRPCYIKDECDILISHSVIYNPYDLDCREAYMLTPRAREGLAIKVDDPNTTTLMKKLDDIRAKYKQ